MFLEEKILCELNSLSNAGSMLGLSIPTKFIPTSIKCSAASFDNPGFFLKYLSLNLLEDHPVYISIVSFFFILYSFISFISIFSSSSFIIFNTLTLSKITVFFKEIFSVDSPDGLK